MPSTLVESALHAGLAEPVPAHHADDYVRAVRVLLTSLEAYSARCPDEDRIALLRDLRAMKGTKDEAVAALLLGRLA